MLNKIKAIVQRYPLAAYFTLAFLISWAGSIAVLGGKFTRGESYSSGDLILALTVMLAGPSLSGIGLTAVLEGKPGLRLLFKRMRLWRDRLGWYLALAIFPVLILTVLVALERLVSPVFHPGFNILGIAYGLLAGFFEEIGWMGFAYPRLRRRLSPLSAGLILGLLWGVWHLAADYLGSSQTLGAYWLPHFAVMWIAGMTATRLLIVWVYENTGSLLLAQLMHASSTGFLVVLSPAPISPAEETLWYVFYAAVLWLIAVRIITRTGRDLVPEQAKQKSKAASHRSARGSGK